MCFILSAIQASFTVELGFVVLVKWISIST